jgi:hypothetical protein
LAGSRHYEKLDHSFVGMIMLNSGTSAFALLVIPFLPRMLVAHRDGESPPIESKAPSA